MSSSQQPSPSIVPSAPQDNANASDGMERFSAAAPTSGSPSSIARHARMRAKLQRNMEEAFAALQRERERRPRKTQPIGSTFKSLSDSEKAFQDSKIGNQPPSPNSHKRSRADEAQKSCGDSLDASTETLYTHDPTPNSVEGLSSNPPPPKLPRTNAEDTLSTRSESVYPFEENEKGSRASSPSVVSPSATTPASLPEFEAILSISSDDDVSLEVSENEKESTVPLSRAPPAKEIQQNTGWKWWPFSKLWQRKTEEASAVEKQKAKEAKSMEPIGKVEQPLENEMQMDEFIPQVI